MPQSWNRMRQANRQPQLHLKRLFYRLDKEQEVLDVARETEQNRLWTELFHNKKEYQKGLRRQFTMEDFFDPTVQIYPSRSNRFKGSQEEIQLSQVYREFLIFKTKKILQLFGDRQPVRPRYSELYDKADAPKYNNERSVTLLLDRARPSTPESKIKQLALAIPERPQKQNTEIPRREEVGNLHLPTITDGDLVADEAADVKLQSQSERISRQKPRFAITGRQSVSRDSLRRELPPVTSSGTFPAAIDASSVQTGGSCDLNDRNVDTNVETNKIETNKTFITQPMERFPPIEKSGEQEESKLAEETDKSYT